MSENNKNESKKPTLTTKQRVVPIILVSCAVLIGACLLLSGIGAIGHGINALLKGLFSFGAYAIPIVLCLHAVCYNDDIQTGKLKKRVGFSALIVILVSCIDFAIFSFGGDILFTPGARFAMMNGGGFVGSILGFLIGKLFGQAGIIIISLGVLAAVTVFFYAEKAGALGKAALSASAAVKSLTEKIKAKNIENAERKQQLKDEEDHQRREAASEELFDDDFFSHKGGRADVKIKQMGIDETNGGVSAMDPRKRVFEKEPEIIPEEKHERRRRSADKPLDLSYGMNEDELSAGKKEEKKPEYNKAFFGLDDSADNVFTKDFDPFDFATSERAAAKYASKVSTISAAVEEELDEFTIYEMKANHVPTEREKRLADLERRKREWLHQKQRREAENGTAPAVKEEAPRVSSISLFDSVSDPAVKKAPAAYATSPFAFGAASDPRVKREPAYATSAAAFGAAFDRDRTKPAEPAPAKVETPVAETAPVAEATVEETPVIESVSNTPDTTKQTPIINPAIHGDVYVPGNTKTVYKKPLTVEFTITKEPKPEPVKPVEAPKPKESDSREATEDVAILIGQRVARSNPTYVRSANDLKTYTKVVSSSADDELYRQLTGSSAPAEDTNVLNDSAIPSSSEPGFDAVAESANEVVFETVGETVNETKLPDPVEFSFGEEKNETPEVTSQSSYQRAAGFASAMMNEPADQFKPYSAPTSAVYAPEAEKAEATMKIERTVLPPNPTPVTPAMPAESKNVSQAASEPLFTVVNEEAEEKEEPQWISEEAVEEVDFSDESLDFVTDEEDTTDEEEPEEQVDDEEIPPEKQNPDVIEMRKMFPFLASLDEKKADEEPPKQAPKKDEPKVEELAEIEDVPFDDPVVAKKAAPVSLVPVEEKKSEKKSKPDYSDYVFPSLDLLAKEESSFEENIQAEIQENADKLIETLASFNVTASIKGVDRGPRITRYEVVPAKGVKVSQIMNLQDDIALSLAAGAIRMEAPIPGKSAVGIEIPNKKSSIVRLRDLLETADFQGSRSKTFVCIGRDVAGQPVFGDIAKMPHLLIAGATGMGKSVCINSLLISVLYKARPDEVKLIMIDPKQVEFTMYNGIPHLLVPVVSDPKQAAGSLMWAVEEMERRYNLLNPLCVRNIDAYNEKVTADPSLGEPMPRIIIVIDEFADLMLQVKDPVETLVMRIAQKARAAGIYLVIGTQRPSVNVITGVIKANVPSRISCKVMSNVDSKTVLDSAGAEKLLDKGDALYAPSGSPKPHRVQCAFVADSEVESIMNYLRQYSDGTNYDSTVMEEIERAAQKCSKKGADRDRDDDDGHESGGEGYLNDRQFLDAVEVAVNTRKISTSLIQRKLSIGYGKAAKFIDIMEDMGIVGEANGQRPREVLLTPDEWREKLARASLD